MASTLTITVTQGSTTIAIRTITDAELSYVDYTAFSFAFTSGELQLISDVDVTPLNVEAVWTSDSGLSIDIDSLDVTLSTIEITVSLRSIMRGICRGIVR